MAKRAPADEPEYNPLGISLVRDVIDTNANQPHVAARERSSSFPRKNGPSPENHLSPEESRPAPKTSQPIRATQEKLSYAPPLRVLLPPREREELDQLVVRLATELGTRVKLSHVIRSCLTILRHSEEQLLKRARKAQGLVRPTNHETIALAEFEDALTDLVEAAFHDTPPRRATVQG